MNSKTHRIECVLSCVIMLLVVKLCIAAASPTQSKQQLLTRTTTTASITVPIPTPVSVDQKTPELNDWVFRHYGILGLLVVSFSITVLYIWWHWREFKRRPGVSKMLNALPVLKLPRAHPDRYAVMIARLENDKDDEHQNLLVQGLAEVEGLQPIALKRTLVVEGPTVKESEVTGHKKARKYLKRSGAHVMIWGRVLTQGDKHVPKLYWTVSEPSDDNIKSTRYSIEDNHLQLPELFWKELLDVLRLLVIKEAVKYSKLQGHFVADKLSSFINRVKSLSKESAGRKGWTNRDRGMMLNLLGVALDTFGEQTGNDGSLEEAIVIYRAALQERTRERMPFDWAMTQNNLGNTLSRLGERKSDSTLLKEGIEAFRDALQEMTSDRVPQMWVVTQANLGTTLAVLGARDAETACLEEAVMAFRSALQVCSRETMPHQWALLQNNLGSALKSLGERDKKNTGFALLKESVESYQAALQVRTRARAPLNWATTQTNLGNALRSLGERDKSGFGTARLEEAIKACKAALLIWSLEKTPLQWSKTQSNMGCALKSLGERDKRGSGTARLDAALEAFQAALQGQSLNRVPLDWAATQNNLGNVFVVLAARKEDSSLLCVAVNHHLNSWEVFSSANASYFIEVTTTNIESDLQELKNTFGEKEYENCVEKHKERLWRFLKL